MKIETLRLFAVENAREMSFDRISYDALDIITAFLIKGSGAARSSYELEKDYATLRRLQINKDLYMYTRKYMKQYKEAHQTLYAKEALQHFNKIFTTLVYNGVIKCAKSTAYSPYNCQLCRTRIIPSSNPTSYIEYCENENLCYSCALTITPCEYCGIHITPRVQNLSDIEHPTICSFSCHYMLKYDTTDSAAADCYNVSYKKYYIDNPL